MADPGSSFAPVGQTVGKLRPDEFDDSIFEKFAGHGEQDRPDEDDGLEEEEPAPQREGLPPGFRMRHDAHYVEELVSKTDAGRIHLFSASETESPQRAAKPDLRFLAASLGESLDAIGACLHLFRGTTRPPAERVALDLVGAEVRRATWMVQAFSVLDEDVPVANGSVDLGAVVKRVADVLAPDRRSTGAAIEVDACAPDLRARGDEPLVTVAVAGIVMALQALAERVEAAVVSVRVREDEDGRVRVEATQEALRMPASWRVRFLDPQWADRPGGRRIAVALAASRRVADLHGGTLTVEDAGHGGCRLALSLPRT